MNDTVCTLVPYFSIHDGKVDEFRALGPTFVSLTEQEQGVVHYAFSYDGNNAHCREGYVDAEAMLAHLDNVGETLQQALTLADLVRLEVHAPASEVEKLREPLADLNPQFYTLDIGFRR